MSLEPGLAVCSMGFWLMTVAAGATRSTRVVGFWQDVPPTGVFGRGQVAPSSRRRITEACCSSQGANLRRKRSVALIRSIRLSSFVKWMLLGQGLAQRTVVVPYTVRPGLVFGGAPFNCGTHSRIEWHIERRPSVPEGIAHAMRRARKAQRPPPLEVVKPSALFRAAIDPKRTGETRASWRRALSMPQCACVRQP